MGLGQLLTRTAAHRTAANRTVAHPDTCSPSKRKSGHLLTSAHNYINQIKQNNL